MTTPASPVDAFVIQADRVLRTVTGHLGQADDCPGDPDTGQTLSPQEQKHVAALMRVNHCGEVCAQALYEGQALTSDNPDTRKILLESAEEEQVHLRWCEQRLEELDDRVSHLNPLFYAASFTTGMIAGLLGDRINLGFVAATEEQVVNHLEEHLASIPASDERSRAILSRMRDDENRHGTRATENGGTPFPQPMQRLMKGVSKLMTRSTYHW